MTTEGPIAGPCTYCGNPDHWRPDCPEIAAMVKVRREQVRLCQQPDYSVGYSQFFMICEDLEKRGIRQSYCTLCSRYKYANGAAVRGMNACTDADLVPPGKCRGCRKVRVYENNPEQMCAACKRQVTTLTEQFAAKNK